MLAVTNPSIDAAVGGLTNRWSAAVNDKVPCHGAYARRAQLRR